MVYNAHVADWHTFAVGELGVLVHNSRKAPGGAAKGGNAAAKELPRVSGADNLTQRAAANAPGSWFERLRASAEGLKDLIAKIGGNGEVDLILKDGLKIELKAWSPKAWANRATKGGHKINQKMMDKLEDQVRRYLQDAGELVMEFAWKVEPELKAHLDRLAQRYGGRFRWIDDVLANGGIENLL